VTSAPPPGKASIWGEGQPDGVSSVQDGVKDKVGCGGNAVQSFGLDKGIERAGLVPVQVGRRRVVNGFWGRLGCRLRWRLRVGDLRRGGYHIRDGNGCGSSESRARIQTTSRQSGPGARKAGWRPSGEKVKVRAPTGRRISKRTDVVTGGLIENPLGNGDAVSLA
jgi:hypothetical protein